MALIVFLRNQEMYVTYLLASRGRQAVPSAVTLAVRPIYTWAAFIGCVHKLALGNPLIRVMTQPFTN